MKYYNTFYDEYNKLGITASKVYLMGKNQSKRLGLTWVAVSICTLTDVPSTTGARPSVFRLFKH